MNEEGIATLADLEVMLTRTEKAFERYENENPPGDPIKEDGDRKFATVGVVRISLEIFSERYRQAELKRSGFKDNDEMRTRFVEVRPLVKPPTTSKAK